MPIFLVTTLYLLHYKDYPKHISLYSHNKHITSYSHNLRWFVHHVNNGAQDDDMAVYSHCYLTFARCVSWSTVCNNVTTGSHSTREHKLWYGQQWNLSPWVPMCLSPELHNQWWPGVWQRPVSTLGHQTTHHPSHPQHCPSHCNRRPGQPSHNPVNSVSQSEVRARRLV